MVYSLQACDDENFNIRCVLFLVILIQQCSGDVEKQLNKTIDELNNRWVAVSDIIVNLEIDIYEIIQLWAAYERHYAEIQEFIVKLSNKIQKEPLETSHGDTSLLPKYKVHISLCMSVNSVYHPLSPNK